MSVTLFLFTNFFQKGGIMSRKLIHIFLHRKYIFILKVNTIFQCSDMGALPTNNCLFATSDKNLFCCSKQFLWTLMNDWKHIWINSFNEDITLQVQRNEKASLMFRSLMFWNSFIDVKQGECFVIVHGDVEIFIACFVMIMISL